MRLVIRSIIRICLGKLRVRILERWDLWLAWSRQSRAPSQLLGSCQNQQVLCLYSSLPPRDLLPSGRTKVRASGAAMPALEHVQLPFSVAQALAVVLFRSWAVRQVRDSDRQELLQEV